MGGRNVGKEKKVPTYTWTEWFGPWLNLPTRKCRECGRAYGSEPCDDVMAELASAEKAFPKMRSAHEGWAILREEVDELWAVVKGKGKRRDEKMRTEAVQVAAMALRFVKDCTKRASDE